MAKKTRPTRRHATRGQSAVETILTLPLALFMLMGLIQLGLLQHARLLAHLAAFNAARAGSVNYGTCKSMTHAAMATLLPAIESFAVNGGGPPGPRMGAAFGNRYNVGLDQFNYNPLIDNDGQSGPGMNESIFWIMRERPLIADMTAINNMGGPQFDEFDDVDLATATRQKLDQLDIQLVFWAPMKIPFANWVMARIALAHWGIVNYVGMNPYQISQTNADWSDFARPMTFSGAMTAELVSRAAVKHYVFPILTSYTMRMMTPIKRSSFATQNCPPAP